MAGNAKSLRRFMIGMALTIGVTVAAGPPLGYLELKYSTETTQIEIDAQQAALRVSRYAFIQGRLWVFHQHRLAEALAGNRSRGGDEWRRLTGPDGTLILAQGAAPASPIARRSPIVVDGAELGWVEITRGMSRHLATTAWIAAASVLFGAFIFAVVYLLPLRALNRAFAALNATNARLERQADATERAHVELQAKHRHLEEVNAQLEIARKEAEAANRAKSQFIANMSHELRTPLNAVIGFTEMIKSQFAGPVAAKYLEYLDDIHKSGTHLLKIVNDVMTHSRMEAGTVRLTMAPVEMKSVMEECCRLAGDQAHAAKITFVCQSAKSAGAVVLADRAKLKQVFVNLLGNAIKFTRPGGSVVMRSSRFDGGIAISVTDTGIGMTQDDIVLALQRFRQVDESHTRRYAGVGLGLPIAKTLVELHQGTMRIDSTLGKGTTVTVNLNEIAAGAGGLEPQLAHAA